MVDYPLFFSEQHPAQPGYNGIGLRAPKNNRDAPAMLNLSAEPSPDIVQFTREQYFEDILKLRDDERERIGHELHDSAGQLLLYLQLSVGRLKRVDEADHHEELLEEIQGTVRQIAAEIRSLAYVNNPVRKSPDDLACALKALVEGFGKRTGCRVSFRTHGDPLQIDDAASLALFRIAQESLVNVHRHAHASRVTIKLTTNDRWLELAIRDNGVGVPSREQIAALGGVGIDGMRFRMEQVGGKFRILKRDHGTEVCARLPLARAT